MNRRQFTRTAALASAFISAVPLTGSRMFGTPAAGSLKKGMMWGGIRVGGSIMEKFEAAKLAGFDGVEADGFPDRDLLHRQAADDLQGQRQRQELVPQRLRRHDQAALGHHARLPLERQVVEAMTINETSFFRDTSPFELLQHKLIPDLIDKRTGDHRSIWKSSSTWTWKLRATVKAEIRSAIIDCCRNLKPGREPAGDRLGYGLLGLLAAQRQRPQFSGVRNDVIELHRFARETWLAHEPRWLAQRTAHNSIPEPVLRPLNDVLATELPLMRRIRVFDEPPRRLADALKRMRTSDADQSPPDT